MRIAFLAGHSSVHTVKWVNEMATRGHEVHLITMHPGGEPLHTDVQVHGLPFRAPAGYYLNAPRLRRLLSDIEPDILNTHYASGYGTLARLSGFHPNLLSVWGSDVFDFPYRSRSSMEIIKRNLAAADRIASTSTVMKRQTESIWHPQREIAVTPFGVDCERFKPARVGPVHDRIRVGTVKRMAPKYGISVLIEAFSIARGRTTRDMELVLVGDGPEEEKLKRQAQRLGIASRVTFVGRVPHRTVPDHLNRLDIYVALSTLDSESFGVAVVEASACGIPVVVSDVGGLPEVVVDGLTGFIVPRNDPEAAAERILQLANDAALRKSMGAAGRRFVLDNYEWNETADRMERLYQVVVDEYQSNRGGDRR
ncbi:MAG: glycosyltransferase [Syntrophomonadaceae bacterium]|jgi:glycosyltransferase involved in cell wall biosynthesis|nr:glycosyltransferase [Syntrophomonadaceae bacterium]MDH7497693.1 glycosyltransferase [Syntrophomonadaceae bacterium]